MKKLISVLVALTLMMSLSVTAFATSYTEPTDAQVPVMATYLEGGAGGTVFSIDVEWSAMEFTYQAAKWAQWDAVAHSYSEATPASWSGSGTVTITNHSNTALDVTPAYEQASGYESTSLIFKDGDTAISDTIIIDSAADTNAAVVKTITVTPDGKLASGASNTQIGTVKVTIAQSEYISTATANALITLVERRISELNAAGSTTETTVMQGNLDYLKITISSGNQTNINKAYAQLLADYNASMEL